MIRLLTLLLALAPSLVAAEDLTFWIRGATRSQDLSLPALFDVSGLGKGDRMSGYQEPSEQSEPSGWYESDDIDIEIVGVSIDREWGLSRSRGWLRMRDLIPRRERLVWAESRVTMPSPDPVRCSGWEPPWGLVLNPDGTFEYESSRGDLSEGRAIEIPDNRGSTLYGYRGYGRNNAIAFTVVIAREYCRGDGQTDHGFTAYVIGADGLVTACCSLVP